MNDVFFEKKNNNNQNLIVNYQLSIINYAATIGFFDGVHLGHRFLLENLKKIAAKRNLKTMAVTFSTHPRKILQPQESVYQLSTNEEKTALLKKTGIDCCFTLDFSDEIRQMSAQDFLCFLSEKFSVKTLLVGYNHHFGRKNNESFEDYVRFGKDCNVEILQAQEFKNVENEKISSSKIRYFLQNGEVKTANRLLGYTYSFEGKVVRGLQNGQKIGFPTANLQVAGEKILPENGVYAVEIEFSYFLDFPSLKKLKKLRYKGMMNIGTRPTFGTNLERTVEVNIFDFAGDIYGENLRIFVLKKIRNEIKFKNIELLIRQLEKDKFLILNS